MTRIRVRPEPTPDGRRFGARPFERRAALGILLCLATAIGLHPGPVRAHVVMGTKSLHLRIAEADLVVRGRVTNPERIFVLPDEISQRRLVEIEVLETLKGRTDASTLRFAQDGHEVARYGLGEEAIFFLVPIAKSRELRMLALPGGPTHVSGQEHDEAFRLTGARGAILLSAVREFAASDAAATPAERVALIRSATLDLLTSGDPQLGASALASLVMSPKAALVTTADLPRLRAMLSDSSVSVGLRAGLIAELERRKLIDGAEARLSLLENAPPADLSAAIRSAGVHPSDAVNTKLLGLMTNPESPSEIKAECAVALGSPGNVAMVAPLAQLLMKGSPRERNAAIRGLGQIGGPEARAALQTAAETHSDPATRARASAKLRAGSNPAADSAAR